MRIQKINKTNPVNTIVFNLHQVKQRNFSGTPGSVIAISPEPIAIHF